MFDKILFSQLRHSPHTYESLKSLKLQVITGIVYTKFWILIKNQRTQVQCLCCGYKFLFPSAFV